VPVGCPGRVVTRPGKPPTMASSAEQPAYALRAKPSDFHSGPEFVEFSSIPV
jgi:hypothetical protein